MTCEPIESDVHSWHKNHASSAIQRRRGWTLLELMIVIAIAGTLIGLVGALLWSALRTQGQAREQVGLQGAGGRLAEAFRSDVAAAKTCQPLDEKRPELGVILAGSAEQRVEYRADPQRVERTAYVGEKVTGRETYQLGDARQAKFAISPEEPRVVSCTLIDAPSGSPEQEATIRRTTVLATLGRDQRQERPGAIIIREPKATITLDTPPEQPADETATPSAASSTPETTIPPDSPPATENP